MILYYNYITSVFFPFRHPHIPLLSSKFLPIFFINCYYICMYPVQYFQHNLYACFKHWAFVIEYGYSMLIWVSVYSSFRERIYSTVSHPYMCAFLCVELWPCGPHPFWPVYFLFALVIFGEMLVRIFEYRFDMTRGRNVTTNS